MEVPFVLDWENRQATCPQGKTSTSWSWLSRKSHPDRDLGSNFPPPIAERARVLSIAFIRRANTHAERSSSGHKPSTPRFKPHDNDSVPKPSDKDIRCGLGLRPPFRKGCGPLTCADLGMWACQKRIYSTWPLLPRSIWFALSTGLMTTHLLLPAFQLLRGSTRQLEEFASSVDLKESRKLRYTKSSLGKGSIMGKLQKVYTKEFKQEAVRLVETSGKSIAQIARELGISDSAIPNWRKELTEHGEEAFRASDGVRRRKSPPQTRIGTSPTRA